MVCCRGITEAHLAYLLVLSLVCLSIFPHGHRHHHLSSVSHNDSHDYAGPAADHVAVDEAIYKQLRKTTDEAGTQLADAPWRDAAGTKLAEASWHDEAGTQWTVLSWRHVHVAWLLLMLVLSRPHNIPLIAVMTLHEVCCRHVITYLCRTDDCVSPVSISLIYLFTAHAAFFYQV